MPARPDKLNCEMPRASSSEPRTSVSGRSAEGPNHTERSAESSESRASASEPRTSVSGRSGEEPLTDVRGSDRSIRSSGNRPSDALAYFITFHTYGTWLHGTERGSVDRAHNVPGTEFLRRDVAREQEELRRLKREPVFISPAMRTLVERTIIEVAEHRGWTLHAVNVRTNHVHLVVETEARPERVMNDLKSFASLCLNRKGLDQPNRKRWARHGSTRWLWKREDVSAAIRYVVDGQGDPMAVFQSAKPLL